MKKYIFTVEDTEEEAGVIQNTDDTIEINFESDEMPIELDNWIVEHVGHRPNDRG